MQRWLQGRVRGVYKISKIGEKEKKKKGRGEKRETGNG